MQTLIVLVTHALQYAGPGSVDALVRAGHHVLAHDASFVSKAVRDGYEARHPQVTALSAQSGDAMAAEVRARGCAPDAVVLNAVHPIRTARAADVTPEDLQSTFAAVVLSPIAIAQAMLAPMLARGSGSIVFVTSARELRPEPGYATPTAMRAATTAFARAMAVEVAPAGVQVNVVAPNYLESQMYYPADRFVDDPSGRAHIAEVVPAGRLGRQDEVGELIAFLASGRAPFVTGQVVAFTGGWAV